MGEAKRKEAAAMNGYTKCCMNCDAWERKSAGNKMGQCRAHAPVCLLVPQAQQAQGPDGRVVTQMVPVVDSYWPMTADYHWCREHAPALHPAIADREALAKIGSMDRLGTLEPVEGNAD